jgi:hypothetical protein
VIGALVQAWYLMGRDGPDAVLALGWALLGGGGWAFAWVVGSAR